MAKKTKVWKQVKEEGSWACDQCNEDYTVCCPTCGHFDKDGITMWTNKEFVLCGDCYPLTMVAFYDQ